MTGPSDQPHFFSQATDFAARLDAVLASPEVRGSGALPVSRYRESPPERLVEDNPRDPALTGIRAVAALLVVGTHAAFATGKLTHGYVGAVYARLEIGVALFFVLSVTQDTGYAGSCPAIW